MDSIFKIVGCIDNFQDIPFDQKIIISGSIGGKTAWFYKIPGIFIKINAGFCFLDDYGISTPFSENDIISLNILGKQDAE